jgi:hypothetical protein
MNNSGGISLLVSKKSLLDNTFYKKFGKESSKDFRNKWWIEDSFT